MTNPVAGTGGGWALELSTARLRLRPLTEDDADWLHAHWAHPDVRRFLWDDEVVAREQVMEQIHLGAANFAAYGFGYWLTSPAAGGPPIGFCGLRHEPETGELELLYSLDPRSWGRGFATEAARAALEHAFGWCAAEQVIAGADPPNDASFRVMERLGMTYRERVVRHGLDAVYYGVTREAWSPAATTGSASDHGCASDHG